MKKNTKKLASSLRNLMILQLSCLRKNQVVWKSKTNSFFKIVFSKMITRLSLLPDHNFNQNWSLRLTSFANSVISILASVQPNQRQVSPLPQNFSPACLARNGTKTALSTVSLRKQLMLPTSSPKIIGKRLSMVCLPIPKLMSSKNRFIMARSSARQLGNSNF